MADVNRWAAGVWVRAWVRVDVWRAWRREDEGEGSLTMRCSFSLVRHWTHYTLTSTDSGEGEGQGQGRGRGQATGKG